MSLASNGTLSLSTINTVLAFTNGNVGIGTSAPSTKLHINGSTMITTGLTTGNVNFTGDLHQNGSIYNKSSHLMGVPNMVFFTTGSSSWTIPKGVTTVQVEAVGGGGGGASGGGGGAYAGGGGGAGGYIRSIFSVTPGNTISYSIGTGGNGASSATSNGSNGNATSVTSGSIILRTGGGGGGFTNTSGSDFGSGGTGGESLVTGGSNVITLSGGDGKTSGVYIPATTYSTGGLGGTSYFGSGGSGSGGAVAARAGQVYGSGGGGGSNSSTSGAAGASGIVIITYFTQVDKQNGIKLSANSSGTLTIMSPSTAFTDYNFNLPTSSGSTGAVLLSGGGNSNPITWTNFVLPSFVSGSISGGGTAIPIFSSSSVNYVEIKGRIIPSAVNNIVFHGNSGSTGSGTTLTKSEQVNNVRKNGSYTTLTNMSADVMAISCDIINAQFTFRVVRAANRGRYNYMFECVYCYSGVGASLAFGSGYMNGTGSLDLLSIVLFASSGTITGRYTVQEFL